MNIKYFLEKININSFFYIHYLFPFFCKFLLFALLIWFPFANNFSKDLIFFFSYCLGCLVEKISCPMIGSLRCWEAPFVKRRSQVLYVWMSSSCWLAMTPATSIWYEIFTLFIEIEIYICFHFLVPDQDWEENQFLLSLSFVCVWGGGIEGMK